MNPVSICSASIVFPNVYSLYDLRKFISGEIPAPSTPFVALPDNDYLPVRTRRRMSRLTQVAIYATALAREEVENTDAAPLIFGTANGEIEAMGTILLDLFGPDHLISPAVFHNSVHNTAPGYWSILSKLQQGANTISSGSFTFEFTLLDAWSRLKNGLDSVQVTVGDEAISIPRWADPGHCSIDFSSSLVLSTESRETRLGILHDLHFIGNCSRIPGEMDALLQTWNPDMIYSNVPWNVPCQAMPFIPGHEHPCRSVYGFLTFLVDDSKAGRLMILHGDETKGAMAMVIEK